MKQKIVANYRNLFLSHNFSNVECIIFLSIPPKKHNPWPNSNQILVDVNDVTLVPGKYLQTAC